MFSPNTLDRNSLEEMLDSLRQREEPGKPKDAPPALPSRPPSRARIRSGRLGSDATIKLDTDVEFDVGKDEDRKKENVWRAKRNTIWNNIRKKDVNLDSPYYFGEELEEQSDSIAYFIKKKLRVWCRQSDGVWVSGTIHSTSGDESFVSIADENVVKVSTSHLFPANPEILDGIDDLMNLCYLNEPSVLHNLKFRFSRDMIYSKAGPVLIAVNPFKDVQIYGDDFVRTYKQKATDMPHIFAIVDTAYSELMTDGINQSLIISGESGSGKTETAKFAMQYLAALGDGDVGIETQILQTSCILEAFGNAKTSRNDNSSRFGKLIDIHFTAVGKISGAKIQTFLLEKLRVVQLAVGERSYHIFYQLCAGAPQILRERLNLKNADEYNYLVQSECLVINGIDDAQNFHKLMEALYIFQISKNEQEQAFAMVAAVLWLGNISFELIDDENHVEASNDEALTSAARLMGCAKDELMQVLSAHRIQEDEGSVVEKFNLLQATDARDSLAKAIYATLFDWLVEQINKLLEVGKQHTGRSICILDIYGFESFKTNSFEQFCINYANERLQQHFYRHLFKLEQEEYKLDGIDGVKVDFLDNQECLDLFEKKPIGLLSLLDEESNTPDANDSTLANKLKIHLKSNSRFKGDRGRAFSVRHFAGEVLYDINGFLKKNQDSLDTGFIELLSSCDGELPQSFAIKMLNQSLKPETPADAQKQGVGTKLKHQFFKLMHQLENKKHHFICCIKPNCEQLPGMYDEDLISQQLGCSGVLEAVRIYRSGYPTRMTHQEFSERYGSLLLDTSISQDPLSISVAVLKQFKILPEMYQIGYTKLYLRIGQIDALEDRRKQMLQTVTYGEIQGKYSNEAANKGSAFASQLLDEQLAAIINLQSVIRGCLVRKHLDNLHNLKQSSSIGKMVRNNSKAKADQDIPNEQPSAMAELQRRVLEIEVNLGKKEQENATLREQLQQCEAKMKKMEEMLQKQTAASQQTSKSADITPSTSSATPDVGEKENGVSNLSKEFEQRKQTFEDDMSKTDQGNYEELRKLRRKFKAWKKDYRARLRESKTKLQKQEHQGHQGSEKTRKKWWPPRGKMVLHNCVHNKKPSS